jgi:C2 domain
MTKAQVKEECMKPSHFWTDSGSGKLGRIFLEILSAENLPNLDSGSIMGNLTDPFVSIVYEDTFLRTDIIDDCLDPVWLPWSNRAFILNIGHASSSIFLGVFDFDAGLSDHDLIGRVSVNITNLRPNTEYLLNYNLYPSAIVSGRIIRGQLNIRLRLEIPDERKLVLSVLDPPVPTYVNVKRGKDFRVVRQTCLGKVDVDRYSLETLKS